MLYERELRLKSHYLASLGCPTRAAADLVPPRLRYALALPVLVLLSFAAAEAAAAAMGGSPPYSC